MAEIRALPELLSALHQDHLDILDVLEVIEREWQRMESGADGDLLLLSDCVEYLHEYANLAHHAGEDVLFEAVASQSPDLPPVVRALRAEHERLRGLTDALREALACMASDTPCDRATFLRLLRESIDVQRAHMEREERDLYPMVADWLRGHPQEPLELPEPGTDPFFCGESRQRYRALHDHITGRIRSATS